MPSQGFFQAINTELCLHAVADPPAQYPPRVPVNHRHQVGKATGQPDIGNISALDLVRSSYKNTAQQVGIDLVPRSWTAGVGTWCHTGQPHFSHQALYPLAVDGMTSHLEKDQHLAAA